LTTAADVKTQMAMAAKDKNKAEAKDIAHLRSIYTAYMKHSLLRPILDAELGPSFFKRIPSSKDELNFRLTEIRTVFNKAGIHETLINYLLYAAGYLEQLPPALTNGYNFSGFQAVLAMELKDMEQEIAELECEYGGWLEASLARRILQKLAKLAFGVAKSNELVNVQNTYAVQVQPTPPPPVPSAPKPKIPKTPKTPKPKKEKITTSTLV
jgi:hypothetical protein